MSTAAQIAKKIPWKYALKGLMLSRKLVFWKKRETGTHFRVEMSEEEIERVLGMNHFTHDWEFSYRYGNEVINMRMPMYRDDEYKWYQLHVRGWRVDHNTFDFRSHTELEPSEYPKGHLLGVNQSDEEGFSMLGKLLDDENVDFLSVEISKEEVN